MKVGGGPFKAKAPSKREGPEVGQVFENCSSYYLVIKTGD